MTFEQMDYFIAAARSETFFDAAETLHISQSSLSKQIMKLERELDVLLFDRSRRSAALTEAGEAFLIEALALSRQRTEMLERMKKYKKPEEKALRIGTLPILSQYGLTGLFKEFSASRPEIRLSIEEVEEQELLAGFASGRYDLIIARSHMCDGAKHRFFLLDEDRLSVMLPVSHPLAKKSSVSLKELSGESFILMHPYTSLYQLCMKLFEEAGISPHIIRTARLESIISAVAVREGISLFAEKNFQLFRHDFVVSVPLRPSPKLSVGAIVKKGDFGASARCFLSFLASRKKESPRLLMCDKEVVEV